MRLAVWRSRRSERLLPGVSISLTEVAAGVDREGGTTALHFRVTGSDARGLDALRETRRAMIREDWTLGLEDGVPSLADAVFTSHDVYWDVPLGERQRCRERVQALVVRANRRLEQTRGDRKASGNSIRS
jgi:hypothetical protein